MSLQIYHCTECQTEFTMRNDTVAEDEELACPACGEPVDEGPGDVDEDDDEEAPGQSQESNPRGRRNLRRPNPLLRRHH